MQERLTTQGVSMRSILIVAALSILFVGCAEYQVTTPTVPYVFS